ncbi:DUF2145 domain-containing protein [Agaribacter flavus]|uniref:DUF2145 domain-containing protein n=1 Tax=Agaribacter flavus TaxID=1902781 RepID=A0ABV7FNR1_9ALTE
MRVLLFICCLLPLSTFAGSQTNPKAIFAPERIVKFSKEVERYAAQQGARAFIIGRVGRHPSDLPRDISFTHTAIAVYSSITLDNGEITQGYAIHNLYQKPNDASHSVLMTDYPVDFFWGAQDLKAGLIIPEASVQLALLQLYANDKAKTLHNDKYSAIANPINSQFQNCTEYTLDLINAAIYQTTDIQRLKANAQAYFLPQPIHKSRLALGIGSAFMPDITTSDHKGKVKTTTFTSIARYLHQYDLLREATVIDQNLKAKPLI